MSLFDRVNGGRGVGNTSNPGNKEVCKFYLEGRCRFGDSCRYYHPPRNQPSQTRGQSLPYHLNADAIKADLTEGDERPSWPLSAYGPGRDAPRELLEGPVEQSPEELRVQYYLAKASGSTQQYEQNERDGLDRANQQAQRILNDMDGAIKYVIDGKDLHPNREDMVVKGPATFNWSEKPSPDQNVSSTGGSTFGQASTFGSGPAFGQTSASGPQQTSTFGQPSTFGSTSALGSQPQTGGSAFGQASNLGSQASPFGSRGSTFGAPSSLGTANSAFGKPSPLSGSSGAATVFGQASSQSGGSPFGGGDQAATNTQAVAFGQQSTPGGGSVFGRPSPFSAAASSGPSIFGQSTSFGGATSQSSTSGATFGQNSTPGQQQSTFGQASNIGQQQSSFGQSSALGQQQPAFGKPSPFGSSGTGTGGSTFGQAPQSGNQGTFGSASTFGSSSNGAAFGRPSAPGQQQSPFGATQSSAAFGIQASNSASAFGQQQQNATPASSAPTTTARPPGQPPTSWKGRPVSSEDGIYFYQNAAGKKERIWHPNGPPGPNADVEAAPPEIYDHDTLANVLRQVYDYVREQGTFKNGLVPEIPPKREWVTFDL